MMLVTSKTGSTIDYDSSWFDRVLSTRCGGKALVVFVDGHVEKRAKEEIEETLSSSDPFWIP
jgi:prepilin-type processing-associated H-X9-DG protein